ncbi:hypothetical protein D1007_53218 [Hordeum vulgare]|nr:hypothetical protein D1007_53218 [Hordeum vulgare]
MIIKEFLRDHIAPLQAHMRPLWEFADGRDPMRLHVSGTYNKMDVAMGALLVSYPEDLPQATPPLYACDDMEGLVAEMPGFDKWGLVGSYKGSPMAVMSSGDVDNDHDSKAMKVDEYVGWIPLPNLHPSLRNLGDDVAADEQQMEILRRPVA